MNEDVHFVAELMNEGIIDIAQLHGGEDNDYIAELRSLLKPANAQDYQSFQHK